MVKNILCRLANCAGVILNRPVLKSRTAPVAFLYLVNASEETRFSMAMLVCARRRQSSPDEIRIKVVDASTIPACTFSSAALPGPTRERGGRRTVCERMGVDVPYRIV